MEPTRDTERGLFAVQAELVQREPVFHRSEQGTSRADFEGMTEPTFWEVGASGTRYSRDFVVAEMAARYATGRLDHWDAQEFYCQELAPELYLLTYTLHQGPRVTRRATIWRRSPDGWKVVYHQGTIVDAGREMGRYVAAGALAHGT